MTRPVFLLWAGTLIFTSLITGTTVQSRQAPAPGAVAVAPAPAHQPTSSRAASRPEAVTERALLDKYCLACHNGRTKAGGLALDDPDLTQIASHTDAWEKVVRKLRAGVMPPVGRPRPDRAGYDRLIGWLETELDRAAAADPSPGRSETFHRLNRTQYRNAVKDLLRVDVDVATLLPADDASYGFDNIAGVLRVSPLLME